MQEENKETETMETVKAAKSAETEETAKKAGEGAEGRKRKVVVAAKVRVVFDDGSGGDPEVVEANRDVFSVMDAVTERLARTKSKQEMQSIRVTVRSLEDREKSDPLRDGEEPWEGPYGVGGVSVEGMTIPDAASELTKAVVPGDWCLKHYETLSEQMFLRSMMSAVTVVAAFPTGIAVIPLINSMREVDSRAVVHMYHGLVDAAAKLREFCSKHFPEKEFDFDSREPEPETGKEGPDVVVPDSPDPGAAKRELTLPSGLPASMAGKGIVTAEEHRKSQIPVVHLT